MQFLPRWLQPLAEDWQDLAGQLPAHPAQEPPAQPPETAVERRIAEEPVSLENLWYVRRHPQQHRENMRLDSLEEAVSEVSRAKRAGVDAVVDVTPKHIGGDPEGVRAVARETGLTYVHGTAYYLQSAHPPGIADRSVEDLADEFSSDIRTGIGETDVRAGLVGEIGLSDTIYPDEEKVLRAGARAACRTGAPLMVHPPGRTPTAQRGRTYPSSRWGLDILDIVAEEGLPADRVVICHMDRTLYEQLEYQEELADRGAYIEYDLWGTELYHEEYDDGYLADAQRIDAVMHLIEEGFADRLLFSHDVCLKLQRTAYGGFGYAHLPENVLPMLRGRGVDSDVLTQITVENPARLLTFGEPEPASA
ncbi:MAG: amidohydrolase family protein [Halobacteriales archaeon]|nr:amidohydrolase family protein [Halobacteriales archaeon]